MPRKYKEVRPMPDNVINFWERAEKILASSTPPNRYTHTSEQARKERESHNQRVARRYRLSKGK